MSQVDEYGVFSEEVEVVYSKHAKPTKNHSSTSRTSSEIESADRGIPVLPVRWLVASYRKMGKHEAEAELAGRFDIESD